MENNREILQKHYDLLFKKMLRRVEKSKEGVKPLSYRPRVYCRKKEHVGEVLGEVENFLMENFPGVKIPPRPKNLQ